MQQVVKESTSTYYQSNVPAIIKKTKLLPLPTKKPSINLSALIKKLESEKNKTNLL